VEEHGPLTRRRPGAAAWLLVWRRALTRGAGRLWRADAIRGALPRRGIRTGRRRASHRL